MKLICHDLYCGLGGWAEGFLSEGYECIGYDIEKHDYGTGTYPGTLILCDVRSIHGSQCKDATVIVASPPCQEPSYRAMPWKRAKALNAIGPPHNFIELFNACLRIQHEASEAAGHYIPLIVENVRGAERWVGRARWHFGSYYLWGDVPALMPPTIRADKKTDCPPIPLGQLYRETGKPNQCHITGTKLPGNNGPRRWEDQEVPRLGDALKGVKTPGMDWSKYGDPDYKAVGFNVRNAQRFREGLKGIPHRTAGHWTNPAEHEGIKHGGDCFSDPTWPGKQGGVKQPGISGLRKNGKGDAWFQDGAARHGSRSDSRKAASAEIAKIPFPLAQHIARCFRPVAQEAVNA